MVRCTTCGAQNPDGALFCDECGASLQPPKPQPVYQPPQPHMQPPSPVVISSKRNCPVCGAPVRSDGAFCENCGASLKSQENQPPAVEVQLPPTLAIPGIQEAKVNATPESNLGIAAPKPLTCTNCGAILEPDSAFCDMCGTPVKTAQPAYKPEDIPLPSPVPSNPEPASQNFGEATVVGGYSPTPENLPSPAGNDGTQQAFAPSQMGQYSPPKNMGQSPVSVPAPPLASAQPVKPYGIPQPGRAGFIIPGSNRVLPLATGKYEFMIGREDPVSHIFPDIDLTNFGGDAGGVSRQHARLTLQGQQYYLTDLQSTNFTYLNGQKLPPNLPAPVNNGDEVQFGKVRLIFSVKIMT